MMASSQKIDPAEAPPDDLAARVQASFDRQRAMKLMGARRQSRSSRHDPRGGTR